MKRHRHTPEQVIRKIREGEKLLNEGASDVSISNSCPIGDQAIKILVTPCFSNPLAESFEDHEYRTMTLRCNFNTVKIVPMTVGPGGVALGIISKSQSSPTGGGSSGARRKNHKSRRRRFLPPTNPPSYPPTALPEGHTIRRSYSNVPI